MCIRDRYTPAELTNIPIYTAEVNRPGLLLSGYESYFDPTRIQIMGNMEKGYLSTMTEDSRRAALHRLFSKCPPAVVITRGLETYEETKQFAAEFKVPVLRAEANTSSVMGGLISVSYTHLGAATGAGAWRRAPRRRNGRRAARAW